MTSKEFLKSRLFDLAAEYPATTIKYYFDNFDNDHFVCIYPNSDLDGIIEKEAIDLDRYFISYFPSESLSFIEIDNNLIFDELVCEFEPAIAREIKTVNFSNILNKYLNHYTESQEYKEPIFRVRKLSRDISMLEKENEEFAFAA